MANKYKKEVVDWAKQVVKNKEEYGVEVVLACVRFLEDLKRTDLELRENDPDLAINIVQAFCVHQQGEDLDGNPLQGKPLLLEKWQKFIIYNLLGFYYKGTNKRRYKEAFIEIGRKNGKAVSLDTPIPTPDGWKLMKDIHVGDYVFGRDGKPAKVLVESPIFHKKMYNVEFEDGTSVKASADHIWTIQSKNSKRCLRDKSRQPRTNHKSEYRENNGWFDTTTEEMAKNFKRVRKDGKGVEYNYRAPMNKAVEYPEKELLIDPYTLGVWLGDGDSNNTRITCSNDDKDEMMANVASFGHKVEWHDNKNRAGGFYIDTTPKGQPNFFRNQLKYYGVFGNKHIPLDYMQSSIRQRQLLLQGLMDTDGSCDKRGECEFAQKNPTLAYQVVELCRSLGIKTMIRHRYVPCNGKLCSSYRITFFTDKNFSCFKLKRKHDRLKESLNKRMFAKSITNIVEIPIEDSKCIMVDSVDHLYLVSDGFTPTHNTAFIAALSLALSILQRKSGPKTYIVASALKQTLEAFNDILFSLRYRGLDKKLRIKDNNQEHSIGYQFLDKDGKIDGSFEIHAMASNPDSQDSFNCSFVIADEVASYKKIAQYTRFKEATNAYENKLVIGITTAGDNVNSFGYQHQEYCIKVVNGLVKDDSLFVLIARADEDENGNIDYTNPIQHKKANLNYGITIRPEEILNESLQAQNDPQKRKDFLSRRLNRYTSSMKAWFDIEEFRRSDSKYEWTLEELAKLPIKWYGGADLSRTYDLTATCLFGNYKGVDIIITHAFFPITQAANKAEEDHIPLFGWQDEGLLTMCNGNTINMGDVINWFVDMKKKGFKIVEIGHDRKFAGEEYIPLMAKAGFRIVDQPQLYYLKSQGFRHIEKSAKDGTLYYLHNEAYEYCVSNVKAVEKIDDAVQYEKIQSDSRIDLFDASVFACVRWAEASEKQAKVSKWFE